MDLVKTGIGITKTIKNMARLREIVAIFARNGFAEILSKTNIGDKIPDFVLPKSLDPIPEEMLVSGKWSKIIGFRLRKAFEELGPSFIKLGQLLSTREDIFPPDFIEEMKILQDQAKPVAFSEIKELLEKRLGKKLDEVFQSVQESPIGMASIGVVYSAVLKNGEEVVLKIRRPNIVRTVEVDFDLIHFLVTQVEKVSEEIRFLGLSRILRDFSKSITYELDFRIEAQNSEKLKRNVGRLKDQDLFYIPKIYKEYSYEDVLVMEQLKGTPFNKIRPDRTDISEIHTKLMKSVHVFVHTLLVDGFFHADLHGGNFFLLEDGRIGIIDFGLMGTLGKKSRENLVAILYSIVTNNFDNLVYEFLDVAEYEKIPDVDELIRDIKDCLTPYMGLSVQETNFSAMLRSIVSTMSKHQIYLPREWFVIFRGLIALDGVGKAINIDLNIFEVINHDITPIMQTMLSKDKAIEEGIWVGRDFMNSMRVLPRHLRWFLKDFSKKNYAFEIKHTGHEKAVNRISGSLVFLGMSLVSSFLFISGTIIIMHKETITVETIPNVTWIFWSLAFVVFTGSILRVRRKKN